MKRLKIIAGLGNPGTKYKNTRHNIGFCVIDRLASCFSVKLKEEEGRCISGRGKISGEDVILLQPLTFMNRSGEVVGELLRYYKVLPKDLILIYDDIDLNTGQLRVKVKGGSGGHRGCASTISAIGTEDFIRVRIGIGRPQYGHEVADYVLSDFKRDEKPLIEEAIENAAEAVRMLVGNDTTGAMNRFNQ
ncbi:MAG: aminoacyl-tRNA hydrolase [Nitrospira sp.]|nr:aminoacyl-tRNA hydrolase [Nitrospira sp.]